MANMIRSCRPTGFLVLALAIIPTAHAQWQREAKVAVDAPQRLTIKQIPQGQIAGMPLDFGVQLQNGKGQPASLESDTFLEVRLFDDSGHVIQSGRCKIVSRKTDGNCGLPGTAAGVYKVQVSSLNQKLMNGGGLVLIRPAPADRRQAPRKPPKAPPAAASVILADPRHTAPLLRVAYPTPAPAPPPFLPPPNGDCSALPKSRSNARIVLAVIDGGEIGGAFQARVDSAKIQALFQAEDGGSAPVDIRVWLSQDHGEIDVKPLLISRCSIVGEAHLTSKYPVTVTINYTVIPDTYLVAAQPQLTATFVIPIAGLGIIPKKPQRLSLIDQLPIMAQFFDQDGNTVHTDLSRTVKFVSDNSIVGTRDGSVSVKPGAYSADTVLVPYWIGKGTISVTADWLKSPDPHEVEVVGTAVIAVCMIGGILGGLVSFLTAAGKIETRLVVGLAAGIILTWAYVFGLLKHVDAAIAHNYLSVFVVSILGGYLGIKAFDIVLKQLGWGK